MPGLAGKQVINFQKCQMTVEVCFPLGKAIILLLSDRVSDISFAGVGLFFSESLVILLHFTFEFSVGAILIPGPKICSNVPC